MWYIFEILRFWRIQIKNSKLGLFDEKIEKINIKIALDYLFQIEEVHDFGFDQKDWPAMEFAKKGTTKDYEFVIISLQKKSNQTQITNWMFRNT